MEKPLPGIEDNAGRGGAPNPDLVIDRARMVVSESGFQLSWMLGLTGLVGLILGGLVGAVVSGWPMPMPMPTTAGAGAGAALGSVVLTAVVTAVLAAVGSRGTMFMGLRDAGIVGAVLIVMVVLAELTSSQAWAAGIAIAVVAFATTLVQSAPLGRLLGALAGLVFLLTFVDLWVNRVPDLAAVSSLLVALLVAGLVAVLVHLPDPRRDSRRLVALAMLPNTALSVHGLARAYLRLDANPPALHSILRSAGQVRAGHSLAVGAVGAAQRAGGEKVSAVSEVERIRMALAGADVARAGIGATLMSSGRTVPRDVPDSPLSALDVAVADQEIGSVARYGLEQIRASLGNARAVLEGRQTPAKPESWLAVTKWWVRARVDSDSSWFRFGAQRAVVLGVGVLIYKSLAPSVEHESLWALLTLFLALAPTRLATTGSVVAASVAVAAGFSVAVPLILVFPAAALPFIAGLLLLLGIVCLIGNLPTAAAGLLSAFFVFLVQVPVHDVPEWGLRRLVAVAVGGAVALIVVNLLLPARSHPRKRAAEFRVAVGNLVDAISAYGATPTAAINRTPLTGYESLAMVAQANLDTDRVLIRDQVLLARYEQASNILSQALTECGALILLVPPPFGVSGLPAVSSAVEAAPRVAPGAAPGSAPGLSMVESGLALVRVRLAEVDPVIASLPR